MKLKYFLLLICCGILLISCKKGESVADFDGVSYKFDGTLVTRPKCGASLYTDKTTNVLTLELSFSVPWQNSMINLKFYNPSVGTVKVPLSASAYVLNYTGAFKAVETNNSIPVSLALTKITNDKVIGSFQFEIMNQPDSPNIFNKAITEGKFGCEITKQ